MNYYILLGLDPDVDDAKVIADAIKKYQHSCSEQTLAGSKQERDNARMRLKLVGVMQRVLQDPKMRRDNAAEAKKILLEQQSKELVEQLAKLNDLIKIRYPNPATQNHTAYPSDIDTLVSRLGSSSLGKAEVTAQLKSYGIKVIELRPKLEPIVAQDISNNLSVIGKKNLYDFLELTPDSSPQELGAAAATIYLKLREKVPTNSDLTAQRALTAHCKLVFKDLATKKAYDNTLAIEPITTKYFNEIVIFAVRNGILDRAEINSLIDIAVAKGVDQEAAFDYIIELARRQRWRIQYTTTTAPSAAKSAPNTDTKPISASAAKLVTTTKNISIATPVLPNTTSSSKLQKYLNILRRPEIWIRIAFSLAAWMMVWAWFIFPFTTKWYLIAPSVTGAASPNNSIRQPFEPEMIVIPAGSFMMGSPDNETERDDDEGPTHEVQLKQFKMGKYEVTFAEYDAFAEATGRKKPDDNGWGRGRRPVINISWDDAMAHAAWLSQQTGKHYRLPTEAEWEYAARAGTKTPFWVGDCIDTKQANYNGNYDYAECGAKTGTYREQPLEVGSFVPNQWGLDDIAGNVWEWTCSDYRKPYDGSETTCSSNTDNHRVLRGGSWENGPAGLRSAYRYRATATNRFYYAGVRFVSD